MYIVATAWEGSRAGFVANTVFQVTSSPAQVAVSCHKDNDTLPLILKSRLFSVSVLRKDADTTLIGEFGFMSSSWFDKFARAASEVKVTGAPVVTGSCVAWLDCRLVSTLDVGTHTLLIGEVADSGILTDEEPLTYAWYREKYRMLAPRNAPTYIDQEKLEEESAVSRGYAPVEGAEAAGGEISGTRDPHDGPRESDSSGHRDDSAAAGDSAHTGTDALPGNSGGPGPARDPDDDEQYICTVCGYVYRPEDGDLSAGIPPGTPFSGLPEDYRCPLCNAGKDYFKPLS